MFGNQNRRLNREFDAARPDDLMAERLIADTRTVARILATGPVRTPSNRAFMYAFTTLVNSIGSTQNEAIQYSTLPTAAQEALQSAGNASYAYLSSVGLLQHMAEEAARRYPGGIPDDGITQTRFTLGYMDRHLRDVIAASARIRIQQYDSSATTQLTPDEAVAAERASNPPFSTNGIRDILLELGDDFGPIVTGILDTQPSDVAHGLLVTTTMHIENIRQKLDDTPLVGAPGPLG